MHHLPVVSEALGERTAQRRLPGTVGADHRHDASGAALTVPLCGEDRADEVPVARPHPIRAPGRQVDRGPGSFDGPTEIGQRGTGGAHDITHVDDLSRGAELEQLVGAVDIGGDERGSRGGGLDQYLRQTLRSTHEHDEVRRDEQVAGIVDVAQQPEVTFEADLAHQ